MRIYQCEDTLEGIFTAIYNCYEDKAIPEDTYISLTEELFLFAEYIPVVANEQKAFKVINTLRRQFGESDYGKLCFALVSADKEKAQAVYRTVEGGLKRKPAQGHLLDNLSDNAVHKVFTLSRTVNNELCHLRGFVRFQELENGILYSKISPKNNILALLMPHFADRFPMENFMLQDAERKLFGVHPAGGQWYLMQGEELLQESVRLSAGEKAYQELFRHFCHKIAIKERRNEDLQRNMLPLRFREYMVEF